MPGPRWQGASNRADRTVEGQISKHQRVIEVSPWEQARCGKYAESNRQIEGAPDFPDISWGEIDGDASLWKLESGIAHRALDPLARFAHAGIG